MSPAPRNKVARRDDDIRTYETRAYEHYGCSPSEETISVDTEHGSTPVRLVTFGETNDKPPVLMLHGISSVSVLVAPLLPYLQGRQVVAVDWPGHGLSGRCVLPAGASLRGHATAVIRSVLDARGISATDIVGHSLGGQFALYAALGLGTRVRRVVLLGAPGAAFSGVRPVPIMRVLAVPGVGTLMLRIPQSPKAFRRNNEKMLGLGSLDHLPPDMLTAAHGMAARRGAAASVASFFRALISRGSVRRGVAVSVPDLTSLAQPVLNVWGDEDVFMRPAKATESFEAIPDHELVEVKSAGHAPWLQNLEQVGAAMADHLSVLDPQQVAADPADG